MSILIDKESKRLLKDFLKEIKVLNENLFDLKKMVAPYLGFKIVADKEKKGDKK